MDKPLVSVIMAVYNTEKYLAQALDSILVQDLTDWELLAIDDGSKDNSGKILDGYAVLDTRIKVYHQENRGVSFTRQFGIDNAKGTYCIHVDSDDWIEPDYLSSLYNAAIEYKADLVWCDLAINEGENGSWKVQCEEFSETMIKALLSQKIWGSLCNRLIRTEICQREDVKFPLNCIMWEDLAFTIQCLLHCKTIKYIQKPLYHYRQNQISLTHQNNQKIMCYEYQKAVNAIDSAIKRENQYERYSYELNSLKLFVLRDYIDDLRIRDFDKFMNTYPEALVHINEYTDYPQRIKVSYWLIKHKLPVFVNPMWKTMLLFKRFGK